MRPVHFKIMDNSQQSTVRRTPSADPTALASFSATVLATIMDTSVFERSVLWAALFQSFMLLLQIFYFIT